MSNQSSRRGVQRMSSANFSTSSGGFSGRSSATAPGRKLDMNLGQRKAFREKREKVSALKVLVELELDLPGVLEVVIGRNSIVAHQTSRHSANGRRRCLLRYCRCG